MSGPVRPVLGMSPAVGVPVVIVGMLALVALFQVGGVLMVMLRVRAAAAGRPGWTWKRDATGLRATHRGLLAGHVGRARWRWLMAGQLPGGGQAQVLRIHSERMTGKNSSVHFDTTTAIVEFPFALPRISLIYDPDAVHPEQPGWDRLHGDPTADPAAAAALYTRDVLDAARGGKLRWQMDGNTVVLTARARLTPARMLELVDYVPTLVDRLPGVRGGVR